MGLSSFHKAVRHYTCCPPRPPPRCTCYPCPCQPCRPICPPCDCRPGPIPPNPCCPRFPGKNVWKKYRNLFFFLCLPLLILQAIHSLGHEPFQKCDCRDYEYMRRRTKRFPWGRKGIKTLFHNPCVNHLPGECTPPPLDCSDSKAETCRDERCSAARVKPLKLCGEACGKCWTLRWMGNKHRIDIFRRH